jgi:chromosome segregation ATPase
MDLSKQIESEQRRLQERSQLAHLQGQLDDLRHRLEQQAARTQLASEQARQVQDLVAHLETKFDARVGEDRLQEQSRLRAFQALQKEVGELRVRVEEPARQILTLMSQFQDLHEGMRILREQLGQRQDEAKKLEQRLEELRAQGLLREERVARLDTLVGQLLQSEDERTQAVAQVRTEVEGERQNLRRQAADVERMAADLRGEQQEFLSRLNRQIEVQRQSATALKALEERLDSQNTQFDRQSAEIQRIEREAVERSLQGQERLESLRQSVQREWSELRTAEERRGESQNTWLRRIEELYHGLDERLAKRDEETGESLSKLAGRMGQIEANVENLMRALMGLFQQQLERQAEGRLQSDSSQETVQYPLPGEKSPGQES